MTEEPSPGDWLSERLRGLRPDQETPEQSEEIRTAFKAHLEAVNAPMTPEQRASARDEHGWRMAAIHAAEAMDPTLRWVRFAERAATEAAVFERLVPPEGLVVYREKFDELIARERQNRET